MININEFSFKFDPKHMAALPSITKKDREIIMYDGVKFYTNEILRQRFILSLMKNTPSKSHKTITKLVNKKIIIPAFLTKSTLSLYFKRKKDKEQDKKFEGVLGFYDPVTKKIFVLIDAGYRVVGWVPDKHLTAVTLHECMHMAIIKNPNKFLTTNIRPLYDYYSEFLKGMFRLKNIEKRPVVEWINYIFKFETGKNPLQAKEYGNRIITAVKSNTSMSDDELLTKTLHIIKYLLGTYGQSPDKIFATIRQYKRVHVELFNAYRTAFKFVPNTTPYQELYLVSEVICILASTELGNNKYVSDSLDIIL